MALALTMSPSVEAIRRPCRGGLSVCPCLGFTRIDPSHVNPSKVEVVEKQGAKMSFFGREKELQFLKDFYHDERENLAVVCGRRRVGKSELLRASLCGGDLPFVFLQCRTTSIQGNVDDLLQLARTEFGLPDLHLNDLEGALKAICAFMKGRRGVLVLDEYPHLRGLLPGCDAVIAHLLDAHRDSGLKLVLCGSSLEVMKALTEERSPLKGKVGLNLHVEPMDYLDSALFYPGFSNEDKVRLYSWFKDEKVEHFSPKMEHPPEAHGSGLCSPRCWLPTKEGVALVSPEGEPKPPPLFRLRLGPGLIVLLKIEVNLSYSARTVQAGMPMTVNVRRDPHRLSPVRVSCVRVNPTSYIA